MWLISSTSSHARRYDMPSSLPAAEMEPCLEISSMSAILPGPRKPNAPKSTRMVSAAWRVSPPRAAARRVLLRGACRIACKHPICRQSIHLILPLRAGVKWRGEQRLPHRLPARRAEEQVLAAAGAVLEGLLLAAGLGHHVVAHQSEELVDLQAGSGEVLQEGFDVRAVPARRAVESNLPLGDLPAVRRKKLTVDFAGGSQSSDAGLPTACRPVTSDGCQVGIHVKAELGP